VLIVFVVAAFNMIQSISGANPPFQGTELGQLEATGKFIFPLITAIASGALLAYLMRNDFVSLGMVGLLILALITVGTSFINGAALLSTSATPDIDPGLITQSRIKFGAAILAVIGSIAGIVLISKLPRKSALFQFVTLTIFGLLFVQTARTAFRANYINYNDATEYLVYAHGAGGVKEVMTQVEEISRRTAGGLNAVVAYVAEQRAGMSPQPAIYRRREIKQRDVSVTLLADMSTSIMQHLPEGGGRLVDRVRAGVLLFAESMEEVGDAYSIAGFCSKYRDNVSYYAIKGFDEPLTHDIRSQIGGMSGRLATRMGAAIRHATACFDRVESRRRLLLILSDGRPEDYDDGGDRRYLHEDTRMAVKEAVAKGVHPFCITVDTMANQYLPQIFGRGHYLVLDHINSLPNKLPEIYFRLRR